MSSGKKPLLKQRSVVASNETPVVNSNSTSGVQDPPFVDVFATLYLCVGNPYFTKCFIQERCYPLNIHKT